MSSVVTDGIFQDVQQLIEQRFQKVLEQEGFDFVVDLMQKEKIFLWRCNNLSKC